MQQFYSRGLSPSAKLRWTITIDALTLERIYNETGLDLSPAAWRDGSVLLKIGKLVTDCDEKIGRCLYLSCLDQIHERGLSYEEFFAGLKGGRIHDAIRAFALALIDAAPANLREAAAKEMGIRGAVTRGVQSIRDAVAGAVGKVKGK